MLELEEASPSDQSETSSSDPSSWASSSKEKLPPRSHCYVVLSENEPKAFLHIKQVNQPVLELPGINFEDVRRYVDQTIAKGQYKIEIEEDQISYHHQEHLSPLNFIQVSSTLSGTRLRLGTTFDKQEQVQRTFFLGLANHLFKDARIITLEEWNIQTISDLEFLSLVSSIYINGDNDEMDRKLSKTFVAVTNEDEDIAYVLDMAGLENIKGEIYFNLSSAVQTAGVKFVKKPLATVCSFQAGRFNKQNHLERKWAIASSIGWLLKGKDFRFNLKKYRDKRRISDMTLAYLAYSSNPDWDPRQYDIESLEERFRAPISLLSLIWELPVEKRREVVLAVWRNNFGDSDFKKAEEFVRNLKPQK